MVRVYLLTQGAALGYVVLPLRGVSLATFDTPSTKLDSKHLATLLLAAEAGDLRY